MEKLGFDDLELKLLTTYRPAKTPIDRPMSKAVVSVVRKVLKLRNEYLTGSAYLHFFFPIILHRTLTDRSADKPA